jgi:hypothetical protein
MRGGFRCLLHFSLAAVLLLHAVRGGLSLNQTCHRGDLRALLDFSNGFDSKAAGLVGWRPDAAAAAAADCCSWSKARSPAALADARRSRSSLLTAMPTARNEKRAREVRRLERELAAARPRPGSGETKCRSVWPEPRERKVFASQEPGR